MSIRIVIDSTSDIPKEFIEKHNIIMLPLTVNFGEDSYLDKVELNSDEFFDKLTRSDNLPTTSQVTPEKFIEAFNKILQEGDQVLGIFLGSDLSGTYESAYIAKETIGDDRIHLIDSRSVCLGTFSLIIEAVQLVEQGKDINEIVEILEGLKDKVEVFVVLDTLKYILKGGRLSKTQAIAGTILNIKPILKVEDSKIEVVDKVRGRSRAIKWIDSWIEKNNIDLSDKHVFLYHARNEKAVNALKDIVENKYKAKNIIVSEVGAVIGTHTGPGALAFAVLNK